MVVAHVNLSPAFAYGRAAPQLPILVFAASLLLASVMALGLFPLIRCTPQHLERRVIVLVFFAGLAARFLMLGATPVLEVDFNRYLWDGGLTLHGYNPYALAPLDIARLGYNDPRLEMSKAAGEVFDAISYPDLKTIYPPVAQAFFALAHGVAAWSLTAWRIVAIAMESVTFGLIVAMLMAVGRSPLWAALYWWSPLVLKETVDSAHMEVLLLPFVLGAVLATIRQRHAWAVGLLALAIGVKLWPVMLVPLVLRPLLARPMALLGACAALAATAVIYFVPILAGGLGSSSGFVSFANHWATNSAHFPALEAALRFLTGSSDPSDPTVGRVLRVLLAAVIAGVAFMLAWPRLRGADDVVSRAYWTVTALLLASPTQFPWYVLWVLPLAVVQPRAKAWFVAAALMPIYYMAFHFNVRGQGALYADWIVWIIWLPVWLVMIRDIRIAPQPQSDLPLSQGAASV